MECARHRRVRTEKRSEKKIRLLYFHIAHFRWQNGGPSAVQCVSVHKNVNLNSPVLIFLCPIHLCKGIKSRVIIHDNNNNNNERTENWWSKWSIECSFINGHMHRNAQCILFIFSSEPFKLEECPNSNLLSNFMGENRKQMSEASRWWVIQKTDDFRKMRAYLIIY